MRTGNPAFSDSLIQSAPVAHDTTDVMTAQGAVNKTFMLLGLLLMAAGWTWHLTGTTPQVALPWIIGGLAGGLVFGLATSFKPNWARVTAPLYAICEGFLLGGISALFQAKYDGIVVPAIGLTLAVLFIMLALYKLRIVRATEKFKTGVIAATGAIFLVYLVSMVLNIFGANIPLIHGNGIVGIGFSVIVVGIAALNLVLDFDFFERGAEMGLAKKMEWYAAFGLLVTLVWLYLEILKLLAKLQKRD